ncbi:hypothetical protein C8R43DRAFT_977127 [Mycena crocata]|nr:hypothetical protein C8R43DRAFT_977127 [Mycena crocata]
MSRHLLLFTAFFLFLWTPHGSQVNVTVDDFDQSIVYSPSSSWNSSEVPCASCDDPPILLASQNTYHKGVHVVLPDADDNLPAPPPDGISSPPGSKADDKDKDNNDADDKPHKKPHKRHFQLPRVDLDDAGFMDTPVSAHFNFTGTAVYIYCIQPLGIDPASKMTSTFSPSLMNVTFSLDDTPSSTFVHQGSSGGGFTSDVNVFSRQNLADGLHTLKLNLAPNSVFILDFVVVTKDMLDTLPGSSAAQTSPFSDLSPTQSVTAQSQLSTPSSAPDGTTTKKGQASFAGAVAGSLGVLGIVCFGTAFSIYLRRKRAARRERLERGSAPPRIQPMMGPVPFVPRYFPGTIVASTPPPYAPLDGSLSSSASSLAAPHASEPLLAHTMSTEAPGYADIPPPLDEIETAPPSFGVAITTPAVTLLSSNDIAHPPPRPLSWGPDGAPHMVALPTSRTPSLLSDSDRDTLVVDHDRV